MANDYGYDEKYLFLYEQNSPINLDEKDMSTILANTKTEMLMKEYVRRYNMSFSKNISITKFGDKKGEMYKELFGDNGQIFINDLQKVLEKIKKNSSAFKLQDKLNETFDIKDIEAYIKKLETDADLFVNIIKELNDVLTIMENAREEDKRLLVEYLKENNVTDKNTLERLHAKLENNTYSVEKINSVGKVYNLESVLRESLTNLKKKCDGNERIKEALNSIPEVDVRENIGKKNIIQTFHYIAGIFVSTRGLLFEEEVVNELIKANIEGLDNINHIGNTSKKEGLKILNDLEIETKKEQYRKLKLRLETSLDRVTKGTTTNPKVDALFRREDNGISIIETVTIKSSLGGKGPEGLAQNLSFGNYSTSLLEALKLADRLRGDKPQRSFLTAAEQLMSGLPINSTVRKGLSVAKADFKTKTHRGGGKNVKATYSDMRQQWNTLMNYARAYSWMNAIMGQGTSFVDNATIFIINNKVYRIFDVIQAIYQNTEIFRKNSRQTASFSLPNAGPSPRWDLQEDAAGGKVQFNKPSKTNNPDEKREYYIWRSKNLADTLQEELAHKDILGRLSVTTTQLISALDKNK